MNQLVMETIDKYYRRNESSDYIEKCQAAITLPQEVQTFVESNTISTMNINEDEIWPSAKITFDFGNYTKGEFEVTYSSTLMISKLAPAFYLQHEFQVENKDENSMTPTLDGFDTQPYNKKQQELDTLIREALSKTGYVALSYGEMNEVIHGLEFADGTTLFGSQVTVGHALFFDLLDLCPE